MEMMPWDEKVYNSCVRHINQKIKSLSACVPRPLQLPPTPTFRFGHICQLNVCNFKIYFVLKKLFAADCAAY